SEALQWMQAADVGVLPYPPTRFSHYGFPLKLFEFLSSGLRVVATPTPSATWAASQFPEVLVSRGYDAPSIAASLLEAVQSPPSPNASSFEAYEWGRMVARFTVWIESRVLTRSA
ncbi:MAG TPA: glycosyltransferase, partial [Thermoplasmata archaeon]|nr:glycosyltransferase [Thermoplasmata archaeon]